ncbi:hypothetical protein DFH06DRAFT_1318364 [Mycena polygramma]|nr:hypothetical protein DFH06DRAFT_1318364 [Mycena polygramma]
MQTKTLVLLGRPSHLGQWRLAEPAKSMVLDDLAFWRNLLEEMGASDRFDIETHVPDLFDTQHVSLEYATEVDVHRMVMDARRAILDCWGHIVWWICSTPNWMEGVAQDVAMQIMNLELPKDNKRGYLISVNRDWLHLNFPLLIAHGIPLYYVWGLFEGRDKCFARLDLGTMSQWLGLRDSNELEGMWEDDVPMALSARGEADRYDRYFQLKLDPYSRSRDPLPVVNRFDEGKIIYYVMDFQGWARRQLVADERAEDLHEFYHHIVVESPSDRTTRVIFHRFHRKPLREAIEMNGDLGMDSGIEPDLSALRERFKGRCAPEYGQRFDLETGIERQRPITEHAPADIVAKYEYQRLLEEPPCTLSVVTTPILSMYADSDTTTYGRDVGPRVTSPDSDHSSERREYDSSEPMAHTRGWVEAMARNDWLDNRDHYVGHRNGRRPEIKIRGRNMPEEFEDARSHLSMSRSGSSRRSASPDFRGRRSYPIRAATPPPFERQRPIGKTRTELEARRTGWLNVADWGRKATFEASMWRIPVGFGWNPLVLEKGYLLIDETSEFRLRFQAIINPAVRFPRHLLELAMERGIPFTIGYKHLDCDAFRPTEYDEDPSRTVTKALVDLRAQGPRLEHSPSTKTVYREYRSNLGKIVDTPQARALILKGGAVSWIARAFAGLGLVRRALNGPSVQVSIHHSGANDSADDDCIDVTWDDVSDGDYEAVFGYIKGQTQELDTYLFPTDAMLEEFSDHYYREWNPFCDKTFRRIKADLDENRGRARTRTEWKHYFQSSNMGRFKPEFVVNHQFIEEGVARMKNTFEYTPWNKRKICDLARDMPAQFQVDF